MGPYQMLPLWVRVDPGAMRMKGHSAFPKDLALREYHYQIVKCHIQDTRCGVGCFTPLQRCSWYILQPKPTGLSIIYSKMYIFNYFKDVNTSFLSFFKMVWFHGISTFVGYLMPKLSF